MSFITDPYVRYGMLYGSRKVRKFPGFRAIKAVEIALSKKRFVKADMQHHDGLWDRTFDVLEPRIPKVRRRNSTTEHMNYAYGRWE